MTRLLIEPVEYVKRQTRMMIEVSAVSNSRKKTVTAALIFPGIARNEGAEGAYL
jgi:hypothetical protein